MVLPVRETRFTKKGFQVPDTGSPVKLTGNDVKKSHNSVPLLKLCASRAFFTDNLRVSRLCKTALREYTQQREIVQQAGCHEKSCQGSLRIPDAAGA